MRVLFMVTRDWLHPGASGGDIAPCEYARHLASVGHEVTMLVSSYPGAERETVVNGVRLVRLGRLHLLWATTFLYYVRHCRGKYDVVVEEGFGGSRIPRLAPLYVKEPIVTEWYQTHEALFAAQYPRPLAYFLRLLERMTAIVHRNTLVQVLAAEWMEPFAALGFKRENIFVLPVSIGEEWLGHGREQGPREPTIVWLGKFRKYKCPHHVIQAMKAVCARQPAARLILVGRHDDRRYEAYLQQLADELELAGNVEFRFNVTEEEKRRLLSRCRGLVVPSSVEGFGLVVLEANACGAPVIASSGVPEGAVRHLANGLRYPFGDIGALADSINELINNDSLYEQLAANGLAFAQQFAWREVGAQYEKLLVQAMERGELVVHSPA